VDVGRVDPEVWHLVDFDQVAVSCLAMVCQLQGDPVKARAVLADALARWSGATRLRRQLIDLEVQQGQTEAAVANAELLSIEPAARAPLSSAIRGACQAALENWIPAMAYLRTAYAAGCRDVICLRWLAVTLLSTGEAADALPILRQWREVDPHDPELRKYEEAIGSPAATQPRSPADEPPVPASRRVRVDTPREGTAANTPQPNVVRLNSPAEVFEPPATT
jgi:hypothetical protein